MKSHRNVYSGHKRGKNFARFVFTTQNEKQQTETCRNENE